MPGHHFQIAIAQELPLPTLRKGVQFTAFVEGWALYAERLAYELGFYEGDPYGNIGRLQAEAFRAYLLRTGVPDYKATPGNRGVYVLQRLEGPHAHFLLISLWDSLEAIRAFAGDDVEKARYYPEDAAYLVEMESTVTHYEVLVSPPELGI